MKLVPAILLFLCPFSAYSQILTNEDSLHAGLISKDKSTVISGYGEVKISYDTQLETARASVTRAVLFAGHRFNKSIALFSEIELEEAKVTGDGEGGELSLEQLYIKFNINRDHYLTAGLFIPRIGIINENHLPTTFNGNDRPFTEQFVIPATWREIGVGLYGIIPAVNGLNYSLAVVNGLNSAGFHNGTGIREGRFSGSNATFTNLAVTGSLLYYVKNFRIQLSGYYGGSSGLTKREADSLLLDNSTFGTPVGLAEMNVKYSGNIFSFTALGAFVNISDAFEINRAYASNTPEAITGGYVEGSMNLLKLCGSKTDKTLELFARYEIMDLDSRLASNGIANDINNKTYIVAGLQFLPVRGVVIKADYVFRQTGEQNTQLILNPFPQALPYYRDNGFVNIGLGYSF